MWCAAWQGEFAESDFEAKAFELPIDVDGAVHSKVIPLQDGGDLRIRGSVDRVDVLEQDGQQFVRVVDYKSGAKPFRLADIVNGLNLQMFLYLFNVCADGEAIPMRVCLPGYCICTLPAV